MCHVREYECDVFKNHKRQIHYFHSNSNTFTLLISRCHSAYSEYMRTTERAFTHIHARIHVHHFASLAKHCTLF